VTGLVLAAGTGRRLGHPKAEVVVRGQRLIDRVVEVLLEGGCGQVRVVVREASIAPRTARAVVNPHPERGLGSSLRAGLAGLDSAACLIALVDQPDITAAEVRAVIGAFRGGAVLVAARRAGRRSHPVLLSRAFFAEVAESADGDQGARAFLDGRADLIESLDFDDMIDIDTPADLARFRSLGSGPVGLARSTDR